MGREGGCTDCEGSCSGLDITGMRIVSREEINRDIDDWLRRERAKDRLYAKVEKVYELGRNIGVAAVYTARTVFL